MGEAWFKTVGNYIELLKPRASSLLTFIGVSAAFIAADGHLPVNRLLFISITILILSGGVNGLTNYLDRDIDARMERTKCRVLPSKRIQPPEKALVFTLALVGPGLFLAWLLHPLSFAAGVFGTVAAVVWRKRATCVFPQGMIASCAPMLIGWFAVKPVFSWDIILLCLLIAFWLPLHVWSVMIANRGDYINAGLTFFPMNREMSQAVKVLLLFSLVLGITAITLFFTGNFSSLYLISASLLSLIMIYASVRLVRSSGSNNAWKLYKLSAFPFLGLLFLALWLDVWVS